MNLYLDRVTVKLKKTGLMSIIPQLKYYNNQAQRPLVNRSMSTLQKGPSSCATQL